MENLVPLLLLLLLALVITSAHRSLANDKVGVFAHHLRVSWPAILLALLLGASLFLIQVIV
jgi:hypothetical protein